MLNNLIAEHGFDFFAANPVGINGITGADFNSIFGFDIRKQDSYQKLFDAKVVGFPFQLPGGALGVSVGVEYRDEGFKVIDSPDPPPPQYVVAYPVYPPITRRVYGYDSGYGYAADNGYAGAYRSYSGGYYPRGYYPARQHFGYRAARHSVRRHW